MRLQQKDFFIPKYVATLRDKVGAKIDTLLDDVEAAAKASPDQEVDFVKTFSEQLPLFTLCEMLGVDEEDRPKIVRWMHYLEMAQQVVSAPWATFKDDPMFIPRYVKNVSEMFEFGKKVMADRRANPRNDLLTVIANSTLGGEKLSQEYLDGSWLLIIFAGNDTTRNSLISRPETHAFGGPKSHSKNEPRGAAYDVTCHSHAPYRRARHRAGGSENRKG